MTRLDLKNPRVLLAALILASLLPVVCLYLAATIGEYRHEESHGRDYVIRLAQMAADRQHDLEESTRHLLLALARMPFVRQTSATDCVPLFVSLAAQYARYMNIGMVGINAKVLASADPARIPAKVSDSSWFREAIKQKTTVCGDYGADMIEGRPVLLLASPVFDSSGKTSAVLFAALDLGWINQFATEPSLPTGTVVTFVNDKGLVLARSSGGAEWVGKKMPEAGVLETILSRRDGMTDAAGPDGVNRTFGFVPLPASEHPAAFICAGVPARTMRMTALAAASRRLGALGIALFLTLSIAWLGMQFITSRFSATGTLKNLNTLDDSCSVVDPPSSSISLSMPRIEVGGLTQSMERQVRQLESTGSLREEMLRTARRELDNLKACREELEAVRTQLAAAGEEREEMGRELRSRIGNLESVLRSLRANAENARRDLSCMSARTAGLEEANDALREDVGRGREIQAALLLEKQELEQQLASSALALQEARKALADASLLSGVLSTAENLRSPLVAETDGTAQRANTPVPPPARAHRTHSRGRTAARKVARPKKSRNPATAHSRTPASEPVKAERRKAPVRRSARKAADRIPARKVAPGPIPSTPQQSFAELPHRLENPDMSEVRRRTGSKTDCSWLPQN